MDRSGPTTIRPARSCCAPVAAATARATGGASTPAVHSTFHVSYRVIVPSWSLTSRPPGVHVGDDRAHVQLDAELAQVAGGQGG